MKNLVLSFSLTILISTAGAQKNQLRFSLSAAEDWLNQPVSVDISGMNYSVDDGALVLYRLDGKKEIEVPSQAENGLIPRLWFLPGENIKKQEKVEYILHKEPHPEYKANIIARSDDKNITLLSGNREILEYRHALIEAPEGIDPLYRRYGAYIHPLRSPSGKVLTRIQPPDHYHHYGIWNPWTLTFFEGREVDFWNLAKGQGTVKHAGILSMYSGQLFGGFKVLHNHIDFTAPGEDKTALHEVWDVRAWDMDLNGTPVWIVDFICILNCATDSMVRLSAYRYGGGIGFRATEEWTNQNSEVLTSEGMTRANADASMARWCRITGEIGQGQTSGIIFMSHPANRSHPEPMRVWPEDANEGRGDVYFEFCPIRHEEWVLEPGKEYVLKYRMVVFDGMIDAGTAEKLWRNFAYPPEVDSFPSPNPPDLVIE